MESTSQNRKPLHFTYSFFDFPSVFRARLGKLQLVAEFVANAEIAVSPWLAHDVLGQARAPVEKVVAKTLQFRREEMDSDR